MNELGAVADFWERKDKERIATLERLQKEMTAALKLCRAELLVQAMELDASHTLSVFNAVAAIDLMLSKAREHEGGNL